jgi:hypothetical protein
MDRTLPAVVQTNPVALPVDLVEAARDFARASHAQRTLDSYARWWAEFQAWAASNGVRALPAAPETVAVWLTALARGDGRAKPLSVDTCRRTQATSRTARGKSCVENGA